MTVNSKFLDNLKAQLTTSIEIDGKETKMVHFN